MITYDINRGWVNNINAATRDLKQHFYTTAVRRLGPACFPSAMQTQGWWDLIISAVETSSLTDTNKVAAFRKIMEYDLDLNRTIEKVNGAFKSEAGVVDLYKIARNAILELGDVVKIYKNRPNGRDDFVSEFQVGTKNMDMTHKAVFYAPAFMFPFTSILFIQPKENILSGVRDFVYYNEGFHESYFPMSVCVVHVRNPLYKTMNMERKKMMHRITGEKKEAKMAKKWDRMSKVH